MGAIPIESALAAPQSDREAAAAAIAGREDAFASIFESHRREVYRTALAILGRHDEALDAVQETFLKVHLGLSGWRGESSLRTWIVRIAVRCSIDMRRRRTAAPEEGSRQAEPSHDPRQSLEHSLRMARLRSMADQLTGQSGLILHLRLFAGHSNKEIAAHLDLSEANVRVQLSNAVRRLKEML